MPGISWHSRKVLLCVLCTSAVNFFISLPIAQKYELILGVKQLIRLLDPF